MIAKTPVPSRETLSDRFNRDGFLSPLRIIDEGEADAHRERMEKAEAEFGKLHYISKIHSVFSPAASLATDSRVLDVVAQLIGPDILLFDVTYIVKEPRTEAFVSWHQDLTYWGFSGDDQVSMWLALTPADEASGCMRMVPGSHLAGRMNHEDKADRNNVLHRGQTVSGVDEAGAACCALRPGEASFHHGWTLHSSLPNRSDRRRIGFNVQYLAPSMRQLVNPHETALLVRGEDRFGHYAHDVLATKDFEPEDVARHAELDRLRKATWDEAGGQRNAHIT
ncbi:MAG: phytanoyl-CoA dioxygenase family protein [Gammaproteobacteria bacterium]|nr:phytanoyl-CoA dioxygenase family protein [Gammaproteobacteria bacterium]